MQHLIVHERPPTCFILHIPLHRFLYPISKVLPGAPSQFPSELRAVQAVSEIMSGSIFHKLDQIFIFAQNVKNGFDNLQIGLLLRPGDVVDLAFATFKEDLL